MIIIQDTFQISIMLPSSSFFSVLSFFYRCFVTLYGVSDRLSVLLWSIWLFVLLAGLNGLSAGGFERSGQVKYSQPTCPLYTTVKGGAAEGTMQGCQNILGFITTTFTSILVKVKDRKTYNQDKVNIYYTDWE